MEKIQMMLVVFVASLLFTACEGDDYWQSPEAQLLNEMEETFRFGIPNDTKKSSDEIRECRSPSALVSVLPRSYAIMDTGADWGAVRQASISGYYHRRDRPERDIIVAFLTIVGLPLGAVVALSAKRK
jgi:hypothetical protein